MLTFCIDVFGYLISSSILDDFFKVAALCSAILCVRILFSKRSETL